MSNDTPSNESVRPAEDEQRKREFTRWFRPSDMPADVRTLARSAATEGAPDEVLRALLRLDSSRWFASVGELWDAVTVTPSSGRR